MSTKTDCPCGSGKDYESCCGPLIDGTAPAETPEALIRSRYTAFARQAMPYIEETLHPSQRHDYDAAGSAKWAHESEWQGLEIVNTSDDPENANRGSVEFKAHYRLDGKRQVHHEIAEFRRTNGTWYFYDGKMVGAGQFRRETPKVGRNDPCPCGSGKKYKRCCGRVAAEEKTVLVGGPRASVKTAEEIEGMRAAGKLAGRVLAEACARVAPGITTDTINDWVHEMTLDAGAYPAPLNYPNPPTDPRNPQIGRRGFPKSVCTSVNDVVCHGIPDDTVLKDGDIVNVDVTCILDGFHGDTSRTLFIGEVSDEARKLTAAAKDGMDRAIALCRDGALFWEIGDAIQTLAEERGFSVVRDFTGHGIGREFHEPPAVLHYRDESLRFPMVAGNIFTIEPMVNAGHWRSRIDSKDGWTARTVDGSLSAQFEHTILVTETGHEILTAPPE